MQGYKIDEGISTIDSIDKINAFLKHESLDCAARACPAACIDDLAVFIEHELIQGNDLWVEYHSNEIHRNDSVYAIHDSLIESFNPDALSVVLVDPEYRHAPRITVTIDVLRDAISTKFGKETGIVVVG